MLISIAIAILAGFYSSSHPDGLEKAARDLGFERKAVSTYVADVKHVGRQLKKFLNIF